MIKSFCTYSLIVLILQLTVTSIKAQDTSNRQSNFRNNIIKINVIPIAESINGHNQKRISIEYERFLKHNLSVGAVVNFGLFEDYTFIKYHDYFDENEGFSYTRKDVVTRGYHFIPSVKFYFWGTKQKKGQGLYISGCLDFNQYFKKSEIYFSQMNSFAYENSSTTRLSTGATLGGQFVAFTRLVIDLNISIYGKLFSVNRGQNNSEIAPLNATWVFNDNKGWSTINLMIGYAFGGGKRK